MQAKLDKMVGLSLVVIFASFLVSFLVLAFGEYLYHKLVVRPEAERQFIAHFDLTNLVESLDEPRKFEFAYYFDKVLHDCDACSSDRVFSNVKHLYTSLTESDRSTTYYEVFRACPVGAECSLFESRELNLVAVSENEVLSLRQDYSDVRKCVTKVISIYTANLCRIDGFYGSENFNSRFVMTLEFPRTAFYTRCCGQGPMQYGAKSFYVDWVSGRAW